MSVIATIFDYDIDEKSDELCAIRRNKLCFSCFAYHYSRFVIINWRNISKNLHFRYPVSANIRVIQSTRRPTFPAKMDLTTVVKIYEHLLISQIQKRIFGIFRQSMPSVYATQTQNSGYTKSIIYFDVKYTRNKFILFSLLTLQSSMATMTDEEAQ